MGRYRLSRKADQDIGWIAQQSVEQWGLARAERYILDLHDAFERLAAFPDIGRRVDEVRPGYRQVQSGRHAIFYRQTADGILIVRVLHVRMDFTQHL